MRLAQACGHAVDVKVFPIDKSQIVRLRPERFPVRPDATSIARLGAAPKQVFGGGEALDLLIARMMEREELDRVIVAFDRFPENQTLTAAERARPCDMRAEVSFVLEYLSQSNLLPAGMVASTKRLLARYASDGKLAPRPRASECLEVVFMDPLFEAVFVSDEQTVRTALGFERRPKDWPKFKTRERALDKVVLDPAVACKTGRSGAYLAAKAKWGREFVNAAGARARLWSHPITRRLCRTLAP